MILKTRIFAVLGGDLRSVAAEKILSDFFTTRLYGFEKLGKNTDSLVKTLENADFVLLPLPLSADGKTLNAPFSEKETFLSELLPAIPEKAVVFGANIPENFGDGKRVFIDLFARDDIQILNAVPTAEGAIAEAINASMLKSCDTRIPPRFRLSVRRPSTMARSKAYSITYTNAASPARRSRPRRSNR